MKAKGLGRVLDTWVERAGLGQAARGASVVIRWPELVGPGIAGHARAETVERGILTVRVSSSVWATELAAHIPIILERITAAVGDGVVRDIRFVTGAAGGRRAVSGYPGSERDTADRRPDRRDLAPVTLSADELDRVRRFADTVADPELARAGTRWLILTLKARRWREAKRAGGNVADATPRR